MNTLYFPVHISSTDFQIVGLRDAVIYCFKCLCKSQYYGIEFLHVSAIQKFSEDRKNLAEVSNGGILMKSDALTTEQLADLNKKLQESLKAQVFSYQYRSKQVMVQMLCSRLLGLSINKHCVYEICWLYILWIFRVSMHRFCPVLVTGMQCQREDALLGVVEADSLVQCE